MTSTDTTDELLEKLSAQFPGALRLFSTDPDAGMSRQAWNNPTCWRFAYGDLAPPADLTFFAEDAFGTQFALQHGSVHLFDAETGAMDDLGLTMPEFVDAIRDDPESTLHLSVYRQAQQHLGPLAADQHYAHHVEMALGGTDSLDNLFIMPAVAHMQALGGIAQQLHAVPDGTHFVPR